MPALKNLTTTLIHWIDSDAGGVPSNRALSRAMRVAPFIAIHLGCFAVFIVGASWPAFWCAIALYAFRVFSLTAFYHRYFAHRTFKTSRFWQFIFAVCAMTAVQRGPLWWAAHHRHHHLHTDTEEDAHSPRAGFWRSHLGWFTEAQHFQTDYSRIRDFARYPELVFLNRFDSLVPILFFVGLYFAGEYAAGFYPQTNGWQFVVWGGCISTVAVYHATFCVNSLCHIFGKKRFAGDDDSRNNWWVALLTFGEGWHNNHHHYPGSARQGFYWWEIDITYYILRVLALLGIVRQLKPVPAAVLKSAAHADQGKKR